MTDRVMVAGGTGNLGARIVRELVARKAEVLAPVRAEADPERVAALKELGVEVVPLDFADLDAVAMACEGVACVVSALAGLRSTIIDTQRRLLDAAVAAGVPRFVPSDFCTDYTSLPPGENRNLDLRRDFRAIIADAPIAATAIFNGAFAEVLTYGTPVFDPKTRQVGYWGEADHRIDFTTMDDTAAFTAASALDPDASPELRIASFQISAEELVTFTAQAFGKPYALVRMGSVEDLRERNQALRAADLAGEDQLYAGWQRGQYLQTMFSVTQTPLDNNRYPQTGWATVADVLGRYAD